MPSRGTRLGRVLGWMAALASAALACNALTGLDGDFEVAGGVDELTEDGSGGTSGTPTGTSGTPTGTSGGTSGTSGSIGIDAQGPLDAAEASAPRGGWQCPYDASLCIDFDMLDRSITRHQDAGGSLAIVEDAGIDGSRALHARGIDVDSGASRTVVWWWRVGPDLPSGAAYTLTFKFRVAAPPTTYAVLGALQAARSAGEARIDYGLARYPVCPPTGGPCFDESDPGTGNDFDAAAPFTDGDWHAAEVVVRRMGASYFGTVKVDGKTLDSDAPTTWGPEAVDVQVGLGIFFAGGMRGTSDVYFDEVAVVRTD